MAHQQDDVFGFYVEKEYVGKRVKGSKVKVTWKVVLGPQLKTSEVELKHSLMFGKREIKLNGQLIFQKKKMLSGDFSHRFQVGPHALQVNIRDDFEGYIYDLSVDDVPFHRLARISAESLDELRRSRAGGATSKPRMAQRSASAAADVSDVKQMRFDDFVRSGSARQPARNGAQDLGSSGRSDRSAGDLWSDVPAQPSAAAATATAAATPWGDGQPATAATAPASSWQSAPAGPFAATAPAASAAAWAAPSAYSNNPYAMPPAPASGSNGSQSAYAATKSGGDDFFSGTYQGSGYAQSAAPAVSGGGGSEGPSGQGSASYGQGSASYGQSTYAQAPSGYGASGGARNPPPPGISRPPLNGRGADSDNFNPFA